MTDLFTRLLQDSLNEYAYDAEIAGLSYSLSLTQTGLRLAIQGYNHKLSVLATKIIEKMKKFVVDENRFVVIKEQVNFISFF